MEIAQVMASDCWPLPEELSLWVMHMHQAGWLGYSCQCGVTGPGACLGHPSGTSYTECQVALQSSYHGAGRQRERESLGEEKGFLSWRPIDRFIWSQTATCTDICRGPTLTWGRMNEGNCGARDNISSQLPWATVGDILKWHRGTTYNV